MTIGELDRRVIIETVSISANSYGEWTRSSVALRTAWAAVEGKGGREKTDESGKITGRTR